MAEMRTEAWNGHAIRFVEKDGQWWAVAQDVWEVVKSYCEVYGEDYTCMVLSGYLPLELFLEKDEYLKDEIALYGARFALTTNGRLVYITHWYGNSEYVVIPNIVIELSKLIEYDDCKETLRKLLVNFDSKLIPVNTPEVIKKIYALFGKTPGEMRPPMPKNESAESIEPKPGEGVYLIQAENGHVKIGCTGNLGQRFRTIETSSPCKVNLIGFYRCKDFHKEESKLHKQFADKRERGEWFRLDTQDLLALNDRFGLGLSVSEAIYRKYGKEGAA